MKKLAKSAMHSSISAVLLRDVLQQQASVANADHDYEQSLLAFRNARAYSEKALGKMNL